MNLSSYFSGDFHHDLFQKKPHQNPLILSGVNNSTAKGFLLQMWVRQNRNRNIFWIHSNNKSIYETRNILPFWLKNPIIALDHFLDSPEDDYRVTEVVFSIHNDMGRIYLLNYEDLKLNIPGYNSIIERGFVVTSGQDIRTVEFFNQLIHMGYRPCTDVILKKGDYRRSGGVVNVYPPNYDHVVKIEVDFDCVVGMWLYDQEAKKVGKKLDRVDFLPININEGEQTFFDYFHKEDLVVLDDIDAEDMQLEAQFTNLPTQKLIFTSFPNNNEIFFHLRYLSVLKYYNLYDLLNDLRAKIQQGWHIVILTKRTKELIAIFQEEKIRYGIQSDDDCAVVILDAGALENVPTSFQNPQEKIQLLTDKEIFHLGRSSMKATQKINLDFLTGLRVGDLIVHLDHGIGRFLGVVVREIDSIHREYLEIGYAENDRLFVPIDQADKVSKYVGGEDNEPKLTRLGSMEWKSASQKVQKETRKIAKDLLELYAKRAQAKGHNYGLDTELQQKFEATFPYEETPGQMKAIADVKSDMESDRPMDRLICGDVGFGKTEVAMRAAFKAAQAGKQVAFISPITILADQHYKTFLKRIKGFDITIEMLSRFRTPKEQKPILERIRKGDIDIVIGTHRLLQDDVKFFNLGLVIIDEEQRFGVKQKEKFKSIRSHVDILTLTATPIPRTLNLSLNKLRDITTITTPPPGRLPIITEVRRHSDRLIIEAIQQEVNRGGQVYFLHNRVQTIESIANKYRKLLPDIQFVVAHGQLSPADLEKRILAFKHCEYHVLISSTIIENGIDLPNANTLIVDNAENFGLSQLYQLRGRIGRGKIQAYAYLLYNARQLRLDAKKRLKAIVDASELGSGFQIAMRDLEIRGAGDVLGVHQHGTIRVVGVNHFLRMLNKTIEEMQSGKSSFTDATRVDVSIELPLEAYIPDKYIPDTKDKINVYQKLSSVEDIELLEELRDDLIAQYGDLPHQVTNLFQILRIKILAKEAGITNIKTIPLEEGGRQIILQMGSHVIAEQIMNLLKYNAHWLISGESLKIDTKNLGFKWTQALEENMKHLVFKKQPIPYNIHD